MAADDLALAILPDRAALRVAGPEAADFLQGLVSNDVAGLRPDRAIYAALLTAQGKYLFDFVMALDGGGAVLLDCERARAAELRQRLLMYRLRAKVEVEGPLDGVAVAAVAGDGAAARLGLPDEAGAARTEGGAVLMVDPRLAALGVRVVAPEAEVPALAERHGLAVGDAAAYDRLRLALGVPDGGRDLVPQKSILLESGFEELNGVSFTKGCFVGQELTARTKHRGLVKKRLFPVTIEGPPPEPGTPVTAGGREAGELRSARDGRGLALLRLEHALPALGDDGPELRAGSSRLRPAAAAWMRLDER